MVVDGPDDRFVDFELKLRGKRALVTGSSRVEAAQALRALRKAYGLYPEDPVAQVKVDQWLSRRMRPSSSL